MSNWAHPGSFEPLKEYAGGAKDAWQAFLDTEHTKEAKKIMESKQIGVVDPKDTFVLKTEEELSLFAKIQQEGL